MERGAFAWPGIDHWTREDGNACPVGTRIFGQKIGSPTNTAKSGSIDEIHKFAAQKGHDNVLLFFSNKPLNISAINEAEIMALKEFKADMRDKGFYRDFDDTEQFGRQLRHQLEMVMNKILASGAFQNEWSRLAVLNERDRMQMEKERIALDTHRKQMEAQTLFAFKRQCPAGQPRETVVYLSQKSVYCEATPAIFPSTQESADDPVPPDGQVFPQSAGNSLVRIRA
jgi:hypothetical protein